MNVDQLDEAKAKLAASLNKLITAPRQDDDLQKWAKNEDQAHNARFADQTFSRAPA